MSCLAGIGAKHPTFLRKLEGRESWIIDGCPIECSRGVFKQVDRPYARHIRLHEWASRSTTSRLRASISRHWPIACMQKV
jgi:uncharacterized metal-binding protein